MTTPEQKDEIMKKLVLRVAEDDATRKDVRALVTKMDMLVLTLVQKFGSDQGQRIEGDALMLAFKDELVKMQTEGLKVRDLPVKDLSDSVLMLKDVMEAVVKDGDKRAAAEAERSEKSAERIEKAIKDAASGQITFSDMAMFFGELMRGLASLLTGIVAKAVFQVQLGAQHYLTPQLMVIYDPITKAPLDLSKLESPGNGGGMSVSVSGGGSGAIVIRGASSFGGGTLTIATAGTRVQLPNIPCRSVTIQSHESNGALTNNGVAVIGGADVIAALGTRNGYALYPTQAQKYEVANTNMLYVDATDNNTVITYTYQV